MQVPSYDGVMIKLLGVVRDLSVYRVRILSPKSLKETLHVSQHGSSGIFLGEICSLQTVSVGSQIV